MIYVVVTHVDARTKVKCSDAPMSHGPCFPALKGLFIDWAEESQWPVPCDDKGVCVFPPKYYGTCDSDADLSLSGVLEVIEEAEFLSRKRAEFFSRKPFSSWTFNEQSFAWEPPVPRPDYNVDYRWDENSLSWFEGGPS